MRNADITFVILTLNEAANVAACIGSLPRGSPVIVYDADSADGTPSLAKAAGATVVAAPWEGYARARGAAAKLVTTPWTFMVDADERVTRDLADELAALEPAPNIEGFSVPRRNWFCGRWIRSAGWWPDRLVRLFRTGHARIHTRSGDSANSVHETWTVPGPCTELHHPLDHYSYTSVEQYRTKFARYTQLEAGGTPRSLWRILGAWVLVPMRFAWLWLGRGGVLEGWRGAYVCAGSAVYPAVVASKSRPRRT